MSDHHFDDDAVDRILSGRVRDEDEAQLADVLATFVAEATSPEPVPSAALARAFVTGEIGTSGDAGVVPLAAARTWRVRRRSLAVRTAITVGAVSVVFSGVAAAGGLPDPLQSVAADAARVIGVQLPDPGRPATTVPDPDDGSSTTVPDAEVVTTTPAPPAPAGVPATGSTMPTGPVSATTEPDDDPERDPDVAVDDDRDDDRAPVSEDDVGEVDDDPAPIVEGDVGEVDDDPAPSTGDDLGEVDDDPAPIVEDDTDVDG